MSQLSREDVIVAAGRLFASKGYHATSMRHLGTELGILGGSLYAHVSSKEELLIEVVRRAGRLFDESAAKALAAGANPQETLRRLVSGHIEVVLDHPDEAQTFLNETAALSGATRAEITAERDRYESVFRSVLKAGVDSGTFRKNVNPVLGATFVLSVLNAVERWYNPDGPVKRAELVDEIYLFATTGLTGDLNAE